MSADWRAGDRALCVDDSPTESNGRCLVLGAVYLVKDVLFHGSCTDGIGLYIAGIVSRVHPIYGVECPLRHTRFRKLRPACNMSEREQTALVPHARFWREMEGRG
jgi:hypothetical protein